MNWLKHNGNASFDSRLIELQEALGYYGYGLYWSIVERVECIGEGCYPRKRLENELAVTRADKRKINQVLDDFNLFVTLDGGLVMIQKNSRTKSKTTRKEPNPTENLSEPTSAKTEKNDPQRARVIEKEKKEKKDNNTDHNTIDNEVNSQRSPNVQCSILEQTERKQVGLNCRGAAENHGKAVMFNVHLDTYVSDMKAEQGEWHEMVCMKSGYSSLLHQYWTEAVEQWRQHVICYDTANQIGDYQRARYYFNSFIKLGTKSGEALKATLEALEARASLVAEEELPDGAPPRPSPNAIWNPAKESWNDFY